MKDITLIKDLGDIGKRYNVNIKIEKTRSDVSKIERQEGIMSDESGRVDFVVWADSGKRYLYEGKNYILKNIKFAAYNGKLQIQVDKFSKVTSIEQERFRNELKKLEHEKQKVAKKKYELDMQYQNIDREKQNILLSREQTLESLKLLDKKKAANRQEKMLHVMGYMLFLMVILAGGVSLYDFAMQRVIPKVNDVIELAFNNNSIPYKVINDDKKTNVVTLESIDEYKETLEFKRPLYLDKPDPETKKSLKKHATSKKNKVYSFDVEKNREPISVSRPAPITVKKTIPKPRPVQRVSSKKDKAVKPAIPKPTFGKIVYINSEQDDAVLMALPNIGPKRIEKLKSARPYRNLDDILNAKIGIGQYWIEKWKEEIRSGRIVFD